MKKDRLAALLRELRLEAHLTQSELATRIGQSQSFISKCENGEQRVDLLQLEEICDALDIKLIHLVERYLEAR